MYIHIGNREIVSKNKVIGIFTSDTIGSSEANRKYSDKILSDTKSIIVEEEDNGIPSIVTTSTLVERYNNYAYEECLFQRSAK